MPSTIKVDQLAGATANTITVPSGQTLDISNATLTLPSNLVTTTGTQTLTNKTINASQLTDASIALSKLSATGTASASTFLRGDNSWGSAGATAGQVIQVVTATDSTTRSTTSASYVTGSNTLSISITPSSASNKIFLVSNFAHYASNEGLYTFFRDSTNLATNSDACFAFFKGVSYGGFDSIQTGMSFLDSPSTTSATTYQIYFRRGASGTAYLNNGGQGVITAFEIKG